MIENATRSLLVNDVALNAVIGERVYLIIKPQNERRPCLVLSLINQSHDHTMDGDSGYTTGTLQIDCFAPSYREAKELAKAVIDALDDYSGTVEVDIVGSEDGDVTIIDWIEVADERDMAVVPSEGAGAPALFGVIVEAEFMIQT